MWCPSRPWTCASCSCVSHAWHVLEMGGPERRGLASAASMWGGSRGDIVPFNKPCMIYVLPFGSQQQGALGTRLGAQHAAAWAAGLMGACLLWRRRVGSGRGAQWAVARENYRRQLKRIHITGFLRGEAVDHYYDWINMRPRHLWRRAFDPCAIAPKVRRQDRRVSYCGICTSRM